MYNDLSEFFRERLRPFDTHYLMNILQLIVSYHKLNYCVGVNKKKFNMKIQYDLNLIYSLEIPF